MPILALIINSEGRVLSINDAGRNFFNIKDQKTYLRKAGDIFHCIRTKNDPELCGMHVACKKCIVRQTGMSAINGNTLKRIKGKLEVEIDSEFKTIYFMVSSVPLKYNNQNLALVLIEDISDIIELKGLIPICANCKNIRNDQGYWTKLEKYIENLTDAEFTHDVCPSCIQKLYPEL